MKEEVLNVNINVNLYCTVIIWLRSQNSNIYIHSHCFPFNTEWNVNEQYGTSILFFTKKMHTLLPSFPHLAILFNSIHLDPLLCHFADLIRMRIWGIRARDVASLGNHLTDKDWVDVLHWKTTGWFANFKIQIDGNTHLTYTCTLGHTHVHR